MSLEQMAAVTVDRNAWHQGIPVSPSLAKLGSVPPGEEWTWGLADHVWYVKIEPVYTGCLDFRFIEQPTITAIGQAIGWSQVEFEKTADEEDKERLDYEIVKDFLRAIQHLRGKPLAAGSQRIKVAGSTIGVLHIHKERCFK